MLTLLSLFTVYDAVLQAIELPMVGGEILLRELAHRQKNALMIVCRPNAAYFLCKTLTSLIYMQIIPLSTYDHFDLS